MARVRVDITYVRSGEIWKLDIFAIKSIVLQLAKMYDKVK